MAVTINMTSPNVYAKSSTSIDWSLRRAGGYVSVMPTPTEILDETRQIVGRIEEIAKDKGTSARAISLDAGLAADVLWKSKKRGTSPTISTLLRLADRLNVRIEEFLSDETTTIGVKVHDIRAAAGDGAQVFDHDDTEAGTLTFDHGYIRTLTNARPDQLMIIQAYGDSMEPTIPSESWVMIDTTQADVIDRGIYAFRDGDDGRIKRLLRHPTKPTLTLHSDNSAWAPITDVDPDQLNIIGRAIWFSKKLA